MGVMQSNTFMSSLVTIRLFIRLDLAKGATQNVEQQMEGRQLKLSWDKTAILNFALARVASLKWFLEHFGNVCADIEDNRLKIVRASLQDEKAEELLLRIFPKSLDRNKLKTTTFFASYFSESGDTKSKAAFYPRLFDFFFRHMDTKAGNATGVKQATKDGLLNSPFVLDAYDLACADFWGDVREELYYLLDLDRARNKEAINQFIEALSGKKTPFLLDEMVSELTSSSGIPAEKVRQSLIRMKQVGIFEDRPGYPEYWRTGRVYKSGLKMKYVRSAAASSR